MTNQWEPPNRDIREPAPGEDLQRPPEPIEAPGEMNDEALDEQFSTPDAPSFTEPGTDPAPAEPNAPSTGLPSDAPGG
jgi:hypothetical protein